MNWDALLRAIDWRVALITVAAMALAWFLAWFIARLLDGDL